MIGNNREKPNLNESAWNKVNQYETTKNLHEVLNRDKYQENLKYLESLSFLKNKNEMMQIYNPNFSIPIAERKLIEELESRQIPYSLDPYGYCLRIFSPNKETPQIIHGINFGLNSTSVVKIFMDKILTNDILRQDGFKIPQEYILEPKNSPFESPLNSYDWLLTFANKIGFPLIVKPNKGERWGGVRVLETFDDLKAFYEEYNNGLYKDKIAIVQKKIEGDEYRVIYLDGKILLAYKKQPLTMIGDGEKTFEELIAARDFKQETQLEIKQLLEKQGHNLQSIPPKNKKIQPYQFINDFSEKDTETPFTDKDEKFVDSIAKSFWARYFWLDIISEGDINQGTIVELNAKPDVLWARRVSPEFNQKFRSEIIDATTATTKEPEKKIDRSFDNWLSQEEFQKKVNTLQFLQNKMEVLNSRYGIKHWIFILLDEIEKNWFPYTIDEYGFVITIHLPNGKNRIIYNADYGFDSSSLRRIFEDKVYTSKILRQGGFSVPEDMIVMKEKSSYSTNSNNTLACLKFAEKVGYPLIFKPNDGSLGIGVQKIFNQEQLLEALESYNKSNKGLYLLQQYISGKDHRVIYLDGEILTAYERIPPKITGNGELTINELIHQNFENLDIDKITTYLKHQNLTLDSVLPQGKEFELLPTANIATGGFVRQVQATERDRKFLEKISKHFWARYFWIDILAGGELADWVILEINKSPITKGISTASEEFRKSYPKKIWETIKKDEGF